MMFKCLVPVADKAIETEPELHVQKKNTTRNARDVLFNNYDEVNLIKEHKTDKACSTHSNTCCIKRGKLRLAERLLALTKGSGLCSL